MKVYGRNKGLRRKTCCLKFCLTGLKDCSVNILYTRSTYTPQTWTHLDVTSS